MNNDEKTIAKDAMTSFMKSVLPELSKKTVPYLDIAEKLIDIRDNEYFRVAAEGADRGYRTFNTFLESLSLSTAHKKALSVCMDLVQEGKLDDECRAIFDKLPEAATGWRTLLSAKKDEILVILKKAAEMVEEGKRITSTDIKNAMAAIGVSPKTGFNPLKTVLAMTRKIPPEEILHRLNTEGITVDNESDAMHLVSIFDTISRHLKEKYHLYEGVDKVINTMSADPEKPETEVTAETSEEPEAKPAEETPEQPATVGEALAKAMENNPPPKIDEGPSTMDRLKTFWKKFSENNALVIMTSVVGILILLIIVLSIMLKFM